VNKALGLRQREVHTDAFMGSAAEADKTEWMALVLVARLQPALGIEGVRIIPVLGHTVGILGHQEQKGVGRDAITAEFAVANGSPLSYHCRGVQSQSFLHRRVGQRHLFEIVVIQKLLVDRHRFLAQTLLPLGIFPKMQHQVAEGAGSGVVRGEEKEAHVCDNVFITEAFTVLGGFPGEITEGIDAVAATSLLNQRTEEFLQMALGLFPPSVFGAWYFLGEKTQQAVGDVQEGMIQIGGAIIVFVQPHKYCSGHIQQGLLYGWEK